MHGSEQMQVYDRSNNSRVQYNIKPYKDKPMWS